MEQARDEFVEPEITKHEEKVADVTTEVGYTDQVGDAC
jgi:hypothetical protein